MNYNIHTRIIFLLSVLCGVFSCSSSDGDLNLTSLFGLQFHQNLPWTSDEGHQAARDLWVTLQEESLIKTEADHLDWSPVYSGSRTGVIIRVEGQLVGADSMALSLRYKGERIYEIREKCYALSLDGILYISNFPTNLQLIINQGGLNAADKSTVDCNQGLKYWGANSSGPSLLKQAGIFVDEKGDWIMDGITLPIALDQSFSAKCKAIRKEEDSYLFLPLKRGLDNYMAAEAEMQRMLLWREGHFITIYDNSGKALVVKGDQIEDSKTIYGIADIYRLKKPWSVQLTQDKSHVIEETYVFEWEDLFMVSDDVRLLESVLSYLILDDPLMEQTVQAEGEFGYIRLAHLDGIFDKLIESTAFPQLFLPTSGAFSISGDSTSLKLRFRSESTFPQPLLYQAEIGGREEESFWAMGPKGDLMIFDQSDEGILQAYDKFGKEIWSLPLEDSIRSFQCAGNLLMLEMEGQYRFFDLESLLLFDEVLPIKEESIRAGLISYPDRSSEEYKVWQQDSFGNIELKTILADHLWLVEANHMDSVIRRPVFLARDTSDHIYYYKADSLYAADLNGKRLFTPVVMESVPQELPVNYRSSNMLRVALAMSNGKVKVVNGQGGHFNLYLLSGMRDFFLVNVNSGPNPEFIAYSDREIVIKGYVREAFKTFASYKSEDYIKEVLFCQSPQGTFFALIKEDYVEILDGNLKVKTSFPSPRYEKAYFYFSPLDASISLVLKDKNRFLVFLLEELI